MDKKILKALKLETERQENTIELIASENYVSKDILKLQGSVLTNKYAEGYPGKKYYGGCEYVSEIENLAIFYAKKLFHAKYVNVQPHSGSSANMAVYKALLNIGDTVLGMDLHNGGHLTHGHPLNFSGKEYNIVSYSLDDETETIDYNEIRNLALKHKPKLIIAGASAYSRIIDFAKFKEIANEVGAYLLADISHIAGLVAVSAHPSPIGVADVVTTTTHKTLRGPRGGIIMTNDEDIAKKIDKVIFPGIQGGPLMHVIAAKAQCFYEAMQPEFSVYITNVVKNSKAMAKVFKNNNIKVISSGTDNHLLLIDVKSSFKITGREAESILESINITVNKNSILNDTESAFNTSGIRLGSPAMTTRGLAEEDFELVANIIIEALKNRNDAELLNKLRGKVLELTNKYPIYGREK